MAADHLAHLAEEERYAYTMAPQWMYDLAEIDAIDAVLGTVGTLSAYAVGGVPGIVAWGGLFGVITVIRKTPLIPWTVELIAEWRSRPEIVEGKFRDAVFPAFREKACETVIYPRQANITERTRADIYFQVKDPVQAQTSTPVTNSDVPMNHRPGVPIKPVHPAGTSIRLWVQQYRDLRKLPALHGRHIVIFGPTGMGKSTIIKWLLRQRQKGTLIICDPHYQPGNWPSRAYVVGKGRNFAEIAESISLIIQEMGRRYEQSGDGLVDLDQVEPIYLVVDEMSALAEQEPEAIKKLLTIAQEGRKAHIFTLLTPHGQNVKTMGLEGRSDARANFAFIEGHPVPEELKHFPRIVSVTLGPPKEKESQLLGQYVIPASLVYTGTPHFGIPNWLRQGVPSVSLEGVPGVYLAGSQGVPEKSRDSVSGVGYTLGTGFEQRFKADSNETHKLAHYLANNGYGIRKIGKFLPFGNVEAQAFAREVLSEIKYQPERPAEGSEAERELVRCLHWECGAPLERIAKLLDGNTWENLSRIQEYSTTTFAGGSTTRVGA